MRLERQKDKEIEIIPHEIRNRIKIMSVSHEIRNRIKIMSVVK